MQINGGWVAASSIWIVGLAAALAVIGFARYQHPGSLARWPAGWGMYLFSQVITLIGLLLSDGSMNWIAMAILWIVWTILDRFLFSKEPS